MKPLVIVMAAALLFGGGGILPEQSQDTYDSIQYSSSLLAFYETTLEGLESRSPNIVKGVVGNDSKTVIHYFPSFPEPLPMYSAVTLNVLEVIKGNGTVQAGDTITIIEPFYIQDRVLYTHGNYLPSIPNQEYYFFLGDQIAEKLEEGYGPQGYEGAHFVRHADRGRYLVPNERLSNIHAYSAKDLSLGEKDTTLYMSLYQDVIDAYMK